MNTTQNVPCVQKDPARYTGNVGKSQQGMRVNLTIVQCIDIRAADVVKLPMNAG